MTVSYICATNVDSPLIPSDKFSYEILRYKPRISLQLKKGRKNEQCGNVASNDPRMDYFILHYLCQHRLSEGSNCRG